MARAVAIVIALLVLLGLLSGTSHAAGLKHVPAWQRQACEAKDAKHGGHYRCTEDGELECFDGWTGDLCNVPICKPGCDPLNGYCTRPGECRCRIGFAGDLCAECAVLPGCAHGTCNKSFECKCKHGWEGIFCTQAVCKERCHKSRGYCEVPGECRCRLGWTGESCEECQTLRGCQNGYCKKPFDCICKPGWTGLLCQNPICRKGCSQEHGYCEEPNQCRCRVGWWGSNCDVCHPYPGCQHGYCLKPWECRCKPGWTGFLCEKKISHCETDKNGCLNGGTCVEEHSEIGKTGSGNFTCACPDGFSGPRCEDKPNPAVHHDVGHVMPPEISKDEPIFIPLHRDSGERPVGNSPAITLVGNSPFDASVISSRSKVSQLDSLNNQTSLGEAGQSQGVSVTKESRPSLL